MSTIVVASEADALRDCLAAVRRQVYGSRQLVVVGGDDAVRKVAGEYEALWRSSFAGAVDALAPEAEHVWIVREQARPLPDALGSLVVDGARADASIAGSKILDDEDPDHLVSVGFATDVFAAPFTGLEADELDQEQYDVIRDVAAVSGISMLVRRDLMLGLRGPDPAMAPTSAAIDLCQRARLRGGRVVIVPSSEVRYRATDRVPEWRERAGEIRAMLKAYSPITLLWALPLALLSGLAESLIAPLVGRWKLFSVLSAWLWNLATLPASIAARLRARRGRVVGDEELFRYQVNGSARLRLLYDEGLERLRTRFPEGVLAGFSGAVEAGQERLRRPAFVFGLVAVVLGLVATRGIWGGAMPVVGFSLPPPESSVEALGAYAGGWNPAGLGSPEVLRPSIAGVAVVQRLLFDNPGAAMAAIVVLSFIAGIFGMARLLRVWGLDPVAGYGAGLVLVAGPIVADTGADGHWVVLPALAAVPWAIAAAVRPFPEDLLRRIGRIAVITLATGVVGAAVPGAVALPVAMVVVWAALGTGERWWAAIRALSGLLLALPLLMPWILYARAADFFAEGPGAFWDPGWLLAGLAVAVVAAPLLAGDRTVALLAGWGGLAAAGGAVLARSADLGLGREAELTGLVVVGVGLALATGAALEVGVRRSTIGGLRLGAGIVGVTAAVLLVLSTALVVAPGRAGLAGDEFGETLAFAVPEDGVTRVLVFGDAERIPGTAYDLEGLGYRVVEPPVPRSWEAYLAEPRLGDVALEAALVEILDGDVRRAGELLSPFGIGWIVFLDESPMEALYETQLDLVPLRSFDVAVFRNEVVAAVAVDGEGIAWSRDGTAFEHPAEVRGRREVLLAVNGDERWGGTWSQSDWANRVTTSTGRVDFEPDGDRRAMAAVAGAWLLVLVLMAGAGAWAGRR